MALIPVMMKLSSFDGWLIWSAPTYCLFKISGLSPLRHERRVNSTSRSTDIADLVTLVIINYETGNNQQGHLQCKVGRLGTGILGIPEV
jgi:hypothetical protein